MAPSATHVADAVARAAAHRRTVRAADPRFAHVSPGALAERVVGLPGRPEPAAGGWWGVGLVVDELTGDELRVWLHPASGRLRIARGVDARPPTAPRAGPGAASARITPAEPRRGKGGAAPAPPRVARLRDGKLARFGDAPRRPGC